MDFKVGFKSVIQFWREMLLTAKWIKKTMNSEGYERFFWNAVHKLKQHLSRKGIITLGRDFLKSSCFFF